MSMSQASILSIANAIIQSKEKNMLEGKKTEKRSIEIKSPEEDKKEDKKSDIQHLIKSTLKSTQKAKIEYLPEMYEDVEQKHSDLTTDVDDLDILDVEIDSIMKRKKEKEKHDFLQLMTSIKKPEPVDDMADDMAHRQPTETKKSITKRKESEKESEIKRIKDDIDITKQIQYVQKEIRKFRESNADYFYIDETGKKTLIKYNHDENLNPLDKNEAHIQALRYYQGMLLILENHPLLHEDLQKRAAKLIHAAFSKYQKQASEKTQSIITQSNHTLELILKFEKILSEDMEIKKARENLMYARDLGVMLEEHPNVVTISKNNSTLVDQDTIRIETSENIRVAENFYDEEFSPDKTWFKKAEKHAGLDSDTNNWLKKFFSHDSENFKQLKAMGVSAPPSARWLPLPANSQDIIISTGVIKDKEIEITNQIPLSRIGTPVSYDIGDNQEEKRLAKKQLKELIRPRLKKAIQEYKEKYGNLAPKNNKGKIDFYISYENLLSPYTFEMSSAQFKTWKDNNGKFTVIANETMLELANEHKEEAKSLTTDTEINLHLVYTNAAINKDATKPFQAPASDYDKVRVAKIKATASLLNHLRKCVNKQEFKNKETQDVLSQDLMAIQHILLGRHNIKITDRPEFKGKTLPEKFEVIMANFSENLPFSNEIQKNEIIRRIRAAFYLRALLRNDSFFEKGGLKDIYQYNIMISALEAHVLGSQALSFAGCKSARDRTAVFAGAVTTMLDNPEAMYNWETLKAGIKDSLLEGHHFRSMNWHNAVAKVDDVHKDILALMPKDIQTGIKSLRKFGKKLDSEKMIKNKLLARLEKDHHDAVVKGSPADAKKIEFFINEAKETNNLEELEKRYNHAFGKNSSGDNIERQRQLTMSIPSATNLKTFEQVANYGHFRIDLLRRILLDDYLHSVADEKVKKDSSTVDEVNEHFYYVGDEETKQSNSQIYLTNINDSEDFVDSVGKEEKQSNTQIHLTNIKVLINKLDKAWKAEMTNIKGNDTFTKSKACLNNLSKLLDFYQDIFLLQNEYARKVKKAKTSNIISRFFSSATVNVEKEKALNSIEECVIETQPGNTIPKSNDECYQTIGNKLKDISDSGKELATSSFSRTGGKFSDIINKVIKKHTALITPAKTATIPSHTPSLSTRRQGSSS